MNLTQAVSRRNLFNVGPSKPVLNTSNISNSFLVQQLSNQTFKKYWGWLYFDIQKDFNIQNNYLINFDAIYIYIKKLGNLFGYFIKYTKKKRLRYFIN